MAQTPNQSNGSAYQLILDHIFSNPRSYEIPLRTMYTLNCTPRAQPLRVVSPSSSADSSPTQPYAFQDMMANQTFAENVMTQLAQLSSQPTSLPPSFITSFLRRCFPAELVFVDFPQALTGLDYLKDLETRRRREIESAMQRMGIDPAALDDDLSNLESVKTWLDSVQQKEHKIDALYSQLYVALRRWILINELSLLPFNKHNCIAMLNTLYPPVVSTAPSSRLTPAVLRKQRDGFFRYVQAVETDGTIVLSNLMRQGAALHDDNGWTAVTRILNQYLVLANSIITECMEITDVQDLSPKEKDPRHHRSKVDSAVSLATSEKRPSTSDSNSSAHISDAPELIRPKTPKGGSALEKIARGLRSMGMNRADVTEILPAGESNSRSTSPSKSKLRKMRSLGNIGERGKPQDSASALDRAAPAFDVNEMRRQRMKYEASNVAQQKVGTVVSHEI